MLTFDGDAARQGDDEDAAFHGKLPPGILPHGLPTVKEVQPAVTAAPQEKKEEEKEKKGKNVKFKLSQLQSDYSFPWLRNDVFVRLQVALEGKS